MSRTSFASFVLVYHHNFVERVNRAACGQLVCLLNSLEMLSYIQYRDGTKYAVVDTIFANVFTFLASNTVLLIQAVLYSAQYKLM